MAIGHHQHRVAGCLDDKTRAAALTDLRDLELDENRRVLDLVQNLPVDRLPPAPRREGQNYAKTDDRFTHVRAPVVPEVISKKAKFSYLRNIITEIGKCKCQVQFCLNLPCRARCQARTGSLWNPAGLWVLIHGLQTRCGRRSTWSPTWNLFPFLTTVRV